MDDTEYKLQWQGVSPFIHPEAYKGDYARQMDIPEDWWRVTETPLRSFDEAAEQFAGLLALQLQGEHIRNVRVFEVKVVHEDVTDEWLERT